MTINCPADIIAFFYEVMLQHQEDIFFIINNQDFIIQRELPF